MNNNSMFIYIIHFYEDEWGNKSCDTAKWCLFAIFIVWIAATLQQNDIVGDDTSAHPTFTISICDVAVADTTIDQCTLAFCQIIQNIITQWWPENNNSVPIGTLQQITIFIPNIKCERKEINKLFWVLKYTDLLNIINYVLIICVGCQWECHHRVLIVSTFLRIEADASQ